MKLGSYQTIADIKRANKARGKFFFERKAMKIFFTRIETGVYSGKFFVDSMKDSEEGPRYYKVRCCHPDGSIETLPHPTPGYLSRGAAIAAMKLAIDKEIALKELRT